MVRDPQGRPTSDGVQSENCPGLVPEQVARSDKKQKASDADWQSMTTADPAFFLKDSTPDQKPGT